MALESLGKADLEANMLKLGVDSLAVARRMGIDPRQEQLVVLAHYAIMKANEPAPKVHSRKDPQPSGSQEPPTKKARNESSSQVGLS